MKIAQLLETQWVLRPDDRPRKMWAEHIDTELKVVIRDAGWKLLKMPIIGFDTVSFGGRIRALKPIQNGIFSVTEQRDLLFRAMAIKFKQLMAAGLTVKIGVSYDSHLVSLEQSTSEIVAEINAALSRFGVHADRSFELYWHISVPKNIIDAENKTSRTVVGTT